MAGIKKVQTVAKTAQANPSPFGAFGEGTSRNRIAARALDSRGYTRCARLAREEDHMRIITVLSIMFVALSVATSVSRARAWCAHYPEGASNCGFQTCDAQDIIRKTIDKAKDGNGTALRICWDRIAPLPKKEPVGCDLPPLLEVSDAASFVAALITAVACGDLVAREGSDIAKLVDTYLRTLEVTELEARVAKLAGTHGRFDQRV